MFATPSRARAPRTPPPRRPRRRRRARVVCRRRRRRRRRRNAPAARRRSRRRRRRRRRRTTYDFKNISSATRRDPTTPHAAPRSNTALRPRRAAARAAGTAAHALAKNSSASAKVPSAPLPVTRSAAMASAATTTPKPLMVAACARAAKSTSGHPPRGASPSPLVAPTHVAARRRGWGATRGSRGATCRSRSASASASLVPGFPARASDARDAGAGVSPPRRIPALGGRRAREDGRRGESATAFRTSATFLVYRTPDSPVSVRGPKSGAFWSNNLRRFGGGGATKATTRRFDRTLAPAAQHASAHERRPPRVSRGSAQQKHGRRTPRSLERSEPSSLVVTARRRRARFICARGARRDTRVRSAHSVS